MKITKTISFDYEYELTDPKRDQWFIFRSFKKQLEEDLGKYEEFPLDISGFGDGVGKILLDTIRQSD